MAGCVKDSAKVRSHGRRCGNVSLVSRREDKLCGDKTLEFIWARWHTVKQQTSLSLLGPWGSRRACLAACVCVWTYVSDWAGGRQLYITYQRALSLHLSEAQIKLSTRPYTATQTHKCSPLFYPSPSGTLLCWHTVESPPNFFSRTTLCYCLWKSLEQFRKHPGWGLRMIGVECKWLWRHWQSTLFVDDWVEIWGEETGSESFMINVISLMDMHEPHSQGDAQKYTPADQRVHTNPVWHICCLTLKCTPTGLPCHFLCLESIISQSCYHRKTREIKKKKWCISGQMGHLFIFCGNLKEKSKELVSEIGHVRLLTHQH